LVSTVGLFSFVAGSRYPSIGFLAYLHMEKHMPKNITMVGDGSMATVCALLLDGNGSKVTVWGAFSEHVAEVIQTRVNSKYLPGHTIPESIRLTANGETAFKDADIIINATPTQFIRPVWERLAPHIPADIPIASVAKGIENETLLRPSQIIADVLHDDPDKAPRPLATISGPSVADELARCLPATVCAASDDVEFATTLQEIHTTSWFRVYTNTDLLGVELAAATKNVIALAAGILDGLQAGNNAKSALLSRGLAEITRLGVAMGAKPETFFGIAGVGDLATTCFSPTGRNRTAGEMLGKGQKLEDVLENVHGVVEGVPTTKSVVALAEKYKVEMPITQAVNQILFESLDPIEAISNLMSREAKAERIG
jgi:glycerol-3-phosphate dehydrogenase (NAD(P)+)